MSNVFFLLFIFCGLCYGAPTANLTERIIGGEIAAEGAAPYQVSLRMNGKEHFCGGAIISPRTILTAAHCTLGVNPSQITIVVGSNKLDSGGFAYGVSWILNYPYFDPQNMLNDLSLIYVAENIQLGNNVRVAEVSWTVINPETTVTLTGWGTTSYPGSIPNDLHIINLRAISNTECRDNLSGVGVIDLSTHLCTYNDIGQGSCQGDSGGPLVYGGQVVGIVSWGYPCAKGLPDVFTRASYYYQWIKENTQPAS